MRYKAFAFVVLGAVAACQPPVPQPPEALQVPAITSPLVEVTPCESSSRVAFDAPMPFTATAYALEGITKTGTRARRGIVAADPRVLPLGSKIRVTGAGSYSGEYLVEDTGAAVKARIIDIKVASVSEAIKFGRRTVQVEVLRWGGEDVEASAK